MSFVLSLLSFALSQLRRALCFTMCALPAFAISETGSLANEAGTLRFTWTLDHGRLTYHVASRADNAAEVNVIEPSPLGLRRADGDFTGSLSFVSQEKPRRIDETYTMLAGKRREIRHQGVEQTFTFKNASGQPLTLTVHATGDAVAFRYGFPAGAASGELLLTGETTGFKLPAQGHAWMLPYEKVEVWSPSYEMPWRNKIAIGTTSEKQYRGWAFPALFHARNRWVLVTEAGMDGTCYAAHLEPEAPEGLYRIRLPEDEETYGVAAKEAKITAPWQSPWRVIVVGTTPAAIVETTAVTDLSAPCEFADTSWIKPGRVSWSWWSDQGSPADYNRLVPFVDLSGDYGWEYSLLDLGWERMERGTIEQLIAYAAKQNVGLILWYNSGGKHNQVMAGLRDFMDDPVKRRAEMARVAALGAKGLKVDFMQSDKQYLMRMYIDILRDAAAHKLVVDFHGSTIPRGWARTFPNLLTQEGIRGAEQYWDPEFAANAHTFHTIYTYTRNVVGSMDYTPVIFGDASYLQRHQTTNAHELALSVAFESGLQHFVDAVASYRMQPDFVQEFLKKVPVAWDETRYLDGVPGELSLLARRRGDTWYIACLNGEAHAKKIAVPLAFLGAETFDAQFLLDGENQHKFAEKKLTLTAKDRPEFDVAARGGFSARLTPKR
jgi:alpha-glucosidase